MSRSTDGDVERYVREKMSARVRKALADAKYDLYYGPGGGGGMGWEKASKIVEEWWDRNMSDDLVVDDAGNVSTKHDFDRYLDQMADEREKEALQEAIDEGIESEEAEWIDGTYQTPAEAQARREAQYYVDGETERSTVYDERDVRRLVLGKDWP
jgi:hypothetical protein